MPLHRNGEQMTLPKQIIYPLSYLNLAAEPREQASREFQERFAAFVGSGVHVAALGRARAGLYLLAKLAVRGNKNGVILSPYTIPDVVNMIRFAEARPIFVDTLPGSTNVDIDHLASLIDDTTCCVVVTHYHFNQAAMQDLRRLCAAKGVMLVDDCALALGAADGNAKIGGTTDASVFSLSGFKALNFLWGGAVTTRSHDLANRLAQEIDRWPPLRFGQYFAQMLKILKYDILTRPAVFSSLVFPMLKKRAMATGGQEILAMVRVESTSLDETILSRPTASALSEWNRKLDRVEGFLQHRRKIAAIYESTLAQHVVGKETPTEIRKSSCVVNYPVQVALERRDAVYRTLMAQGFDVGLSLYPNVHEMEGFEQIEGRSNNVARLVRSVISLPTHMRVSEEYATRLAAAVTSAIN